MYLHHYIGEPVEE